MKLETPDGCYFSLNVDRYEFPNEELGPTEDNPAEDFEIAGDHATFPSGGLVTASALSSNSIPASGLGAPSLRICRKARPPGCA